MDDQTDGERMAWAVADVRRSLAPPADHPLAVEAQCRDCLSTFRRWPGNRAKRCSDCAARRQITAQRSLHEGAGPAWRKYAATRGIGDPEEFEFL